jgi:hypothetical protein
MVPSYNSVASFSIKHTEQVGTAVTIQTCTQKVLSLNLNWETDYPVWGFFVVFLLGKYQDNT